MTQLTKPVKRNTNGLIREAGKLREVVVILRPPNVIGFRAKGCRKEYQLTTEICYNMAVKAEIAYKKKIKKNARSLRKVKCIRR